MFLIMLYILVILNSIKKGALDAQAPLNGSE